MKSLIFAFVVALISSETLAAPFLKLQTEAPRPHTHHHGDHYHGERGAYNEQKHIDLDSQHQLSYDSVKQTGYGDHGLSHSGPSFGQGSIGGPHKDIGGYGSPGFSQGPVSFGGPHKDIGGYGSPSIGGSHKDIGGYGSPSIGGPHKNIGGYGSHSIGGPHKDIGGYGSPSIGGPHKDIGGFGSPSIGGGYGSSIGGPHKNIGSHGSPSLGGHQKDTGDYGLPSLGQSGFSQSGAGSFSQSSAGSFSQSSAGSLSHSGGHQIGGHGLKDSDYGHQIKIDQDRKGHGAVSPGHRIDSVGDRYARGDAEHGRTGSSSFSTSYSSATSGAHSFKETKQTGY